MQNVPAEGVREIVKLIQALLLSLKVLQVLMPPLVNWLPASQLDVAWLHSYPEANYHPSRLALLIT